MIVVNKISDTPLGGGLHEIRPLDARSLALSALLGTHPPVLPGRAFVALADVFGIAGGTMRTALSRMVAGGELVADDGRYQLTGALLDRQRDQDAGRRLAAGRWNGAWHTAVALDDQRALADRRRDRRVLGTHRFGELRPDIWARPGDLPAPSMPGWVVTTGPVSDPEGLTDRLWDRDGIARQARSLIAELEVVEVTLGRDGVVAIPTAFMIAASVVRFLRVEPRLPATLLPGDWPVDRLRSDYDRVELVLQQQLRGFFQAVAVRS